MGRQRKHPPPRFLTVVANTEKEAFDALMKLRQLSNLKAATDNRDSAEPARKRGRQVRVDRLRQAMSISDDIPPKPAWLWRKSRGAPGQPVTPTREARAAQRLIDICAKRDNHNDEEELSIANATRIIEQARELTDRVRMITKEGRAIIEKARGTIGPKCSKGEVPLGLTQDECRDIRRAAHIVLRAPSVSAWDREFLSYFQVASRRGALRTDIA